MGIKRRLCALFGDGDFGQANRLIDVQSSCARERHRKHLTGEHCDQRTQPFGNVRGNRQHAPCQRSSFRRIRDDQTFRPCAMQSLKQVILLGKRIALWRDEDHGKTGLDDGNRSMPTIVRYRFK